MKVALGLEYPLTMGGGVSVLVEKLIEGISTVHEIVLVSPDPAGFSHPGVCAHIYWEPGAVSRRASKELADRLAGLRVALVHLHAGGNFGWGWRVPGQSPIGFLKHQRIPCISTIHVVLSLLDGYCDPKKPIWFKLATLPVAWLGKLDALRSLSAEIVVSQKGCARVRRWYWPMRHRFRCIYHSRLSEAVPGKQPIPREPLILAVGHLALRKGQHVLVEAFTKIAAAHPEWKLALIGGKGSDDCLERVQDTVAQHKLNERVLLLGNRNDAFDFMQRAAVFVQPSLFEGLPLALQEAMFYGCACIATNVPGNDEMVEDGLSGLLVPSMKADALADAIDRLIRDPTLRTNLGKAAKNSVLARNMTQKAMIDQHLALYGSLLPATEPGFTPSLKPAAGLKS
jgi:glycosyltransferase involved in cell wall biosynthesis